MIKNIFLVIMAVMTFGLVAEAQYYPRPYYPRPYPPPYYRPLPPVYPSYPVPVVPLPVPVAPYVYTCNAIGLVNGLVFYGVGTDTYTASQRALFVCQSSGQYCQVTNCR